MFESNYTTAAFEPVDFESEPVETVDFAKKVKRRVRAEPRFYLKLVERDKDILYELKDFFKCGNVYFQKDERENRQNCYRYEVANRKHLQEIIIPFFKKWKPKLFSKRKDFEIFCEIMEKIGNNEHLTESGLRKLYKIKQKMHH